MSSSDCSIMTKSEADCRSMLKSGHHEHFDRNRNITKIESPAAKMTEKHFDSGLKMAGSSSPSNIEPTNRVKVENSMSRSTHNLQLNNLCNFGGQIDRDNTATKQPAANHNDLDDVLKTIETVCKMVKCNQFTPILTSSVFSLYDYLKKHGEKLEETNRDELNQVFVAIRQACCRDAGQLGTPCRLKMMELIELRALKWRPSLAHSQYYVDKGSSAAAHHVATGQPTTPSPQQQQQHQAPPTPPSRLPGNLAATPISAPPFGAMPLNPFSFALRQHHVSPVMSPADMLMAAMGGASPQTPSYFLIPTGGGAGGGGGGIGPHAALLQSPAGAPTGALLPTPPGPAAAFLSLGPFAAAAQLAAAAAAAASDFARARSSVGAFPQPTKIPGKSQFRDEVVIRNADSGKIMGVKGRRVSIIEELSNSIISFQKVAQNVKERTLTITGPNEESILHAKLLIEDTIRRNVSPTREACSLNELQVRSEQQAASAPPGYNQPDHPLAGSGTGEDEEGDDDAFAAPEAADDAELQCALSEMGSVLKLSCADPQVLKVARQALQEYFQRRPASLGRGQRYVSSAAYNKERRKSMPLPLGHLENLIEGNESPPNISPKGSVATDGEVLGAQSRYNARSTPNLLTAGFQRLALRHALTKSSASQQGENGDNRPRIVYTRDFLLKFSKPYEKAPEIYEDNREAINEIFLTKPNIFDVEGYKKKFAGLKCIRF